jgi:zinc protease
VVGTFLPTPQPERAEIPATSDLQATLSGYKGAAALAAGEAFDPSPKNIDARVERRTLANGIRTALLPKSTRGGKVVAQLSLNWGDEKTKAGRSTACGLAGGMLLRGTEKRSRAELRDAFDRLKATVSVTADGASIETQREHLDETLRLVAEALRRPPSGRRGSGTQRASAQQRGDAAATSAIAAEQLQRYLTPYPKATGYVRSVEGASPR